MTKIKAAETGAERVPVPVQLTVKCGIVGLTRVRAAQINRTRTRGNVGSHNAVNLRALTNNLNRETIL